MSDQMRDEFAAWYLAEVTESYGAGCRAQAEKNLAWVRQDGSFADPMLRLACLAWQASRESMPSAFTVVDMGNAETSAYRCLAEHLVERLAEAFPDSDAMMTVECFADWLSKEIRR